MLKSARCFYFISSICYCCCFSDFLWARNCCIFCIFSRRFSSKILENRWSGLIWFYECSYWIGSGDLLSIIYYISLTDETSDYFTKFYTDTNFYLSIVSFNLSYYKSYNNFFLLLCTLVLSRTSGHLFC